MIIRLISKIVMHTFFSRVWVHHGERLPANGAVLIVSNHHSGLVDPVALLATMRRAPRFLAKASLWEPKYLFLRPFLWLAKAIPVFRHVDGGGSNANMFAASHQVLSHGQVIALFAEGVSHDMPGLLDLKTGAARIALGVDAPVWIVPVGLIYDDRATFRSRVMIYVGEPIAVAGETGGDDDRARVHELTARIADGLDQVAPSWESWEAHHAALLAARLAVAERPGLGLGEVLTQLNRAVDEQAPAGQAVLAAVVELEAEAARLGLDGEAVVDQPRDRVGRLDRFTYLVTTLIAVPTIVGRLVNLPPHSLIGWLADRQDLNFRATFKIIVAIFLYPLWWIVAAGVVGGLVHPGLVPAVLFGLPALGYLAARTYGRLRRLRARHPDRIGELRRSGSGLAELRRRVLVATDAVLQPQEAQNVQKSA